MEGVKAMSADAVPPLAEKAPAGVQTIRLGGTMAAGNLQQSSPPVHPPLAKAAGVQGTVKVAIHC
jgi:hypothetical protein